MEMDFYEDYKNLALPELVKVARSPWDYLPEAVTAATRILKERGITAEEIAAEEWTLAQKEMSDALAKRRFGDYFDWFWELLRVDRSKEPAEKWFALFIMLYSLHYVYNLYHCTESIAYFVRCESCRGWKPLIIWDVGVSIYSTICIYLVLKQKRLGWSLLCIQAVIEICSRLLSFYRSYERHLIIFDWTVVILPFMAYTALLLFLFRPYLLQVFRIDGKFRDRILLIAGVMALLKVMFI
jgi:hypothetical protein